MSSSPVIGVTAADQRARWGYWDTEAALVPAAYLRALEDSGAVPVVLAPPAAARDDVRSSEAAASDVVRRIDALVLTGGADVDPALYGQAVHESSQQPEPARDAYELALLRECGRQGVPVLAICRGMQLLNVSRGGSLCQHLPDAGDGIDHMPEPGSFSPRRVRVAEGSRLAAALGRADPVVPCHHHQAVERVGHGLRVSARAEDGVVEAIEDPTSNFLIAVQWHPEAGEDPSLFRALVRASESRYPS